MRKLTLAARIVMAMGILTTATVAHAPLLELDANTRSIWIHRTLT